MTDKNEGQPRGWEGEGFPKAEGPGKGQPTPNAAERFPVSPRKPATLIGDIVQAHEIISS